MVAVVHEDDYYLDFGPMSEDEAAAIDFDDIRWRDHRLLKAHIGRLKAGGMVNAPTYDYVLHRRREETTRLQPSPILILEGLHVLAVPAIRNLADLRIYLECPHDVALARRISRDVSQRGATPSQVVAEFQKRVVPAQRRFVEPTKRHASLVADGSNMIAGSASGPINPREFERIVEEIRRLAQLSSRNG